MPSRDTASSLALPFLHAYSSFHYVHTLSCSSIYLSKLSVVSMGGLERVFTLLFLFSSLLLCFSEANDILVGGKADAWKLPSSPSDSLNQWAESSRFRIGDSLVWKYDSQEDSVLEVTKEAYLTCNTSNPIKEYKDGFTKVKLERSGPLYFISGAEGHCGKGQKMIVVVLSARHRYTGISPVPAHAPAEFDEGPAVAPTSRATTLKASAAVALGLLLWGLF